MTTTLPVKRKDPVIRVFPKLDSGCTLY